MQRIPKKEEIPEGYEELAEGDIIHPDDIAYNMAGWTKQGEYLGKSCHVQKHRYNKIGYYFTCRLKKDKKQIKEEKFRFFKTNSFEHPVVASKEKEGFIFSTSGNSYFDYGQWNYSLANSVVEYKEINFSQALQRFDDKKSINKFLNYLAIEPKDYLIKVEEKDKELILKRLKEARAFNEDSAAKMSDMADACITLSIEGVIGARNDKYFIKNAVIP